MRWKFSSFLRWLVVQSKSINWLSAQGPNIVQVHIPGYSVDYVWSWSLRYILFIAFTQALLFCAKKSIYTKIYRLSLSIHNAGGLMCGKWVWGEKGAMIGFEEAVYFIFKAFWLTSMYFQRWQFVMFNLFDSYLIAIFKTDRRKSVPNTLI